MSMKKLDRELDSKIREITESEAFYLASPGQRGKKYDSIKKILHKEKEVYFFELLGLDEHHFDITKNSRFTDVPEHIHSSIHMSYVYSGECQMKVNGRTLSLKQNDICFIDRNVVRSKEYLGENDIVISIHFSKDFLTKNILGKLSNASFFSNFIISALSNTNEHSNYIYFNSHSNEKIRLLFIQLIEECYDRSVFSNEIISSFFSLIMMELILRYRVDTSKHVINISREDNNEILDIIKYIEDNFISCTLNDLSREFGYSEKYISQIIKNKSGLCFKDIQTTRRISYAAHLLEATEIPIRLIAEKVGIFNENFFYKKFREVYKKTPMEYRNHFNYLNSLKK